jgi:uncharacterized cysteine cluster protein YcgN (CxxCxxCC family)
MSDATDEATAEHEAKCRRCGQSCHFAVPVNGLPVVVDDLHCKYLQASAPGQFICSVYSNRFEVAPWCATVDEAIEGQLLAQNCLYTSGIVGYRGKTRLHRRLMAKAEPGIRQSLLRDGGPIGLDLAGARRFLDRTGGGDFDIIEDTESGRVWFRPRDSSNVS